MPKHSRQSSRANDRRSSKQSLKKKNSSKRRKTIENDEDNHVNNFFEILQQSTANSVSIKLAIQEWKEAINEVDNTKPMAELINFILESSGCQGKITPDIFEERDDINEVLTELQNDSAAGLTDYPIISKQKQFTGNGNSRNVNTFIGKLRRFWRDWVKEMQYEIMNVDDNWIFDNLKVWIISMSSSNFRPFRHTSTVIGLSLGIELCAVANSIQSELTIAERQINKEQTRKKNGSNSRNRSQREVQLEKKIEELQAKKERLNTHIDDFFVGLFIHRYRDFTDIIRIECANNIRFWIKEYPIYFLNDNYTRYIGWFLSDKSERVRLYALHGFITILSLGEEWMSMFMSFIERFKSRIFEMAKREVNKVVQNLAIVTISEIGKLGLLDEEDYEDIIPLLFLSESKECKHLFNNICANVLNDLVNKNDEEENEEEEEEMERNEDDNEDFQQKQKFKNMKKLKNLIQLLVKYGESAGNEIAYCNKVVSFNKNNNETISSLYDEVNDWFNDSLNEKINEFSYESYENAINILWDISDVVKDYNSALQYLSYDLSEEVIQKRNLSLTEEEEICLIWIIRSSIINSIKNMKKQNSSNSKKNKDDEDKTDLENLNRDVMKILPLLLNKYNSDFDNRKIDSLLDIIKELNIELYIDLRIPKSFDELFESLNVIYSKTKNTLILDKCASIYSFLIGYSNSKDDSNENQDHYDNSSLVSINEIGKRHFSTLLNEIFLKQITISIDTINEMLNEDKLEENAQTFFESLNYGIKRIVCLLKQIDLQIFKDLIPDYYKTFNQAISISETLLKKKNIILKKLDKNNGNIDNNESTIIVDLENEGNKDSSEIDSTNGKNDKQLVEIEQLIQEIVSISISGLYLDINWNGVKLEELEKIEAIRLTEKKNQEELEEDIQNELEKEMEEDEERERNEENEKEKEKENDNGSDENGKEKSEKGDNSEIEDDGKKIGKEKENENKNENEEEKEKEKDEDENENESENEQNDNKKDKNEKDKIEESENKKEKNNEKEKETTSENKEGEDETIDVDKTKENSEGDSSTKKKSELEIEKDSIKEKIESLIINNQKILNKNNRKYWTWRSRYFAYHKLADIYLLCNSKFDSLITTDYLKIPTLSIQKEMVNVINECLELVFDVLLNKTQEEYIEDNCISRKDYSKLMIYSIIGYQLSSLITPLQKLVLSGIIGVENASNIMQWIEFVNYYVESNDTVEDEERSSISTDNDINIINNYWIILCQKIIDEVLNKYPKSLIENETKNAAKLTKTNSEDQEEIQKATKAATSIIIKVRTVIDKLLEELARQSISKTYSLFLKYSKEGQVIPTKLFKLLFNAIKSWSNVSTSSAIRKVVLQALVIFLKKSNQIFFNLLPENISEISEDDKNSIIIKSSSLWSSLSIIAKAYNSFIINNDEKELYNNMIKKEIIDDFEKKFDEIKIVPSEENDIWSSYYEYINVLKSGKVIKKKGGSNRKRTYSKTVSRESSVPNSNINSPAAPKNPPKRRNLERNTKKKNSGRKSKYYVSDSDTDTEITEFETDENETEEEKEEEEEQEEEQEEEEQEEEGEEKEQEAIELTESSASEDEEGEEEKEEESSDNENNNSDSTEESDEDRRNETILRSRRNTRSRSNSISKRNTNNKRKGNSTKSSSQRKRQKK